MTSITNPNSRVRPAYYRVDAFICPVGMIHAVNQAMIKMANPDIAKLKEAYDSV